MFRRERIEAKSEADLVRMRRAGLLVHDTLALLRERLVPGVTTAALDATAEDFIRSAGALPSFQQVPGYRHTLCVSLNDEVVHGIPGERALRVGDLVSIDCGAQLDGWHGDSATTAVVGGAEATAPEDRVLIEATEAALWAGIAACRVGARLKSVGGAIEDEVDRAADEAGLRLGIVEGYTGHGIGRHMHMEPDVHNFRVRGRTPAIPSGAALAIEPMVTLGTGDTSEDSDGWTVRTTDGAHAAHWEHTVAVTTLGVWVLTAADGGRERLAALGVPFGALAD